MVDVNLKAQDDDSSADEIHVKADMFYLDAVNKRLLGNHAEAFELYRHTLDICPEHVGANYDLSSYYHGLGENEKSGELLQAAANADPANYWVSMGLVQLYSTSGNTDKAIQTLEGLAKAHPASSSVLLMLEDLYLREKNYDKVIDVLNRIETHEGNNEQISMEKYRIYRQMGDVDAAMEVLEKLDQENPNDVRYKVMKGDVYLDNDQFDKAFAIYENLYEKEPGQLSVLLALAGYYERTRDYGQYQKILEEIVINEALSDDIRLSVMQEICTNNLFGKGENDTTVVMNMFDRILQLPQENTKMVELCARYMISSEMPKERIKPVLYRFLDLDPEADIARNQLLYFAIEDNDNDEVKRLCNTAVGYSSDNPMYYYYLGVVDFGNHEYEEAIEVIKKGLTKVDKETNLDMTVNMYAVVGDSYHRLGNNPKAYEYYDTCLLYKPNQVVVLNNYAYYLSIEKRNLAKAEEMARKAIEKEKDNPTYLDTYAWVLFQQKRYDEAKAYIDKILNLLDGKYSNSNATLLEHAGDVYSKCGQKEKAVRFWKIASELGTKSTTINKKISKKRYVEF